jgi:hypothetical protein
MKIISQTNSCFSLLIILISLIIFIPNAESSSEKNILTLINKSGDHALVKLVGQSRKVVEVPNGSDQTIYIAGGKYLIYARYGNGPKYRFTRGESFTIQDSATSYTQATLTLHGVINGNYSTYDSSEDEFNRQR